MYWRWLNSPRIALIHHGSELIGLLVLVWRQTQDGGVAHGLHHSEGVPGRSHRGCAERVPG